MKFLEALQNKNRGRPPIWFMRQAGRYLPEYLALRAKHSLHEMFFSPHLAAQVTLMPLARYPLDAAILFADITSIAPALGFDLDFREGPVVSLEAGPSNWRSFKTNLNLLDPIAETAALVKQKLEVPLIGFCGGPYTIATYLCSDVQTWMNSNPQEFDAFLDWICDMCIHSLRRQIKAGADAIQIFDSWADQLEGEAFDQFSLKFMRKIVNAIDHPTILFMRGSSARAEQLASIGPVCISLDGPANPSEIRGRVKNPLQGNLDPDLLFEPVEVVRQKTRELLTQMADDPGYIVNLAHGVKPKTPPEAVAAVVDEVMSFKTG